MYTVNQGKEPKPAASDPVKPGGQSQWLSPIEKSPQLFSRLFMASVLLISARNAAETFSR